MDTVVYSGPAESLSIVREALGDRFEVLAPEPKPDTLLPALAGAVAFLDASMKVPIDAAAVAGSPRLRLVVTATTGASHIDGDALAARGIPLLTLKGQTDVLRSLTPAAELSWLLLMACARRLRPALRHVDEGGWDRTLFPGMMLKGKTLGVIGLGRIGSWMSRYARAFDMRVQGYDPFIAEAPEGVTLAGLDDLLATSDFVSLHVNLTDETRGMLDAAAIGRIKPGAVFVNTSRGELVDESALAARVAEGDLGGVGVDVLCGEPDVEANPLWRLARTDDRVVITPHIGGFSHEAVDVVVAFSCRRILDFFEAS